jgi:hypothetical protein
VSRDPRKTIRKMPSVIIDGVPQHEPAPETTVPCPRQGLTHCEACGAALAITKHDDVPRSVRAKWRKDNDYPESSVPADRFEKDGEK